MFANAERLDDMHVESWLDLATDEIVFVVDGEESRLPMILAWRPAYRPFSRCLSHLSNICRIYSRVRQRGELAGA